MTPAALLQMQMQTVRNQFARTVQDLSAEQLSWQPNTHTNSIGFTLWHVLRTWDDYWPAMGAGDEMYEQEGWPQRFGFETKGRGVGGSGMGTGFTPEDVAVVKPPPDVLSAYLEALWTRTQFYLGTATDDSLAREFKIPWWPNVIATPARVLSHIIAHSLLHLGEAQYLKGSLPPTQ